MNDETFMRESLLGLEPLNPQMRQRFEQQVRDIYDAKLTRGARLYWRLFLAASLIGAAGSAFGLLPGPHARSFWLSLFLVAVWAANSAICAWVLVRGRVDSRKQFAAGKFASGVAFLIVMVSFAYAMTDPRRPEAAIYGIYALALFGLVSGINLWNRICEADYHTQEHALRLEYRLADLASRLPAGHAAGGAATTEPAR
jgi:hypothetical protein